MVTDQSLVCSSHFISSVHGCSEMKQKASPIESGFVICGRGRLNSGFCSSLPASRRGTLGLHFGSVLRFKLGSPSRRGTAGSVLRFKLRSPSSFRQKKKQFLLPIHFSSRQQPNTAVDGNPAQQWAATQQLARQSGLELRSLQSDMMETQDCNSSDIRPEAEVDSVNASNNFSPDLIEDFNDVPCNQGDFDQSTIDPSGRPSKKIRCKKYLANIELAQRKLALQARFSVDGSKLMMEGEPSCNGVAARACGLVSLEPAKVVSSIDIYAQVGANKSLVIPDLPALLKDDKRLSRKELAKARRAIEELKRENQVKNKECQEAWSSLQELQNELMCKSMHVGALAYAIEGQVKEKSKWFSSLRDFKRKMKILKLEHIRLTEDALEYKKCLAKYVDETTQAIHSAVSQQLHLHKELQVKFSEGEKERKELYNKEIAMGASVVIDFDAAKDGELTLRSNGCPKKTFKFDAVFFGLEADQLIKPMCLKTLHHLQHQFWMGTMHAYLLQSFRKYMTFKKDHGEGFSIFPRKCNIPHLSFVLDLDVPFWMCIAERNPGVEWIVIPAPKAATLRGFSEAVKNWPKLKSLTVCGAYIPHDFIEETGKNCRNFSELKTCACF
ncbi:hypothetical protein Ancab_032635 [Ancistrocladus abbreviatus]